MRIIDKISALPEKKRWWVSIGISGMINFCLYVFAIYFGRSLGLGVFGIIPLSIGILSTSIYGSKHGVSKLEALGISWVTLALLISILLMVGALSQDYLLFMVAVSLIISWFGSLMGILLIARSK